MKHRFGVAMSTRGCRARPKGELFVLSSRQSGCVGVPTLEILPSLVLAWIGTAHSCATCIESRYSVLRVTNFRCQCGLSRWMKCTCFFRAWVLVLRFLINALSTSGVVLVEVMASCFPCGVFAGWHGDLPVAQAKFVSCSIRTRTQN